MGMEVNLIDKNGNIYYNYSMPFLNMYRQDLPHLPATISRENFVNIIFDIGFNYSHNYDTIMATVQIGDRFVSFTGARTPFIDEKYPMDMLITSTYNSDKIITMSDPVPQVYSVELAHVVSMIAAKCNEDSGYRNTNKVLSDTQNRYIIKMECEVCMVMDFTFEVSNFITVVSSLLYRTDIDQMVGLSSQFLDLCKDICMNKTLLEINPFTLILACILLHKRGKLRAIKTNRERIFVSIMKQVAHEYEIKLDDLLKEYVKFKCEKLESQQISDDKSIPIDSSPEYC